MWRGRRITVCLWELHNEDLREEEFLWQLQEGCRIGNEIWHMPYMCNKSRQRSRTAFAPFCEYLAVISKEKTFRAVAVGKHYAFYVQYIFIQVLFFR
jgi:hypothetical protein